ncbi:hypothetical protein QYF36_010396 [Acer negundo]|nr:hypothetical protein QYF36_010396 [Acer negundo]
MLRNSCQGQKIVNRMGTAARSWANEAYSNNICWNMIGVSFPTLSLTKLNLPFSLLPNIDLSYIEEKGSGIKKTTLNALSSLKG